ncbi:S8 family serine peptidase [Nakamurella leprariae]|uniref:S8 family serine peptidase n=1 Tax=Nakamurella leprariae TaxID=2803911 RepID=A0A939BWV7_9ACTN|nr:S8 family serine peptidase [Nakamurella leprariae]MBM9467933.1 S8 family serine peptidase [Nakamurella leprariae]
MIDAPDRGPIATRTDRYVVVFRDDVPALEMDRAVRDLLGQPGPGGAVARAEDFADRAVTAEEADRAAAVVFDELGVAVIAADPDRYPSVQAAVSTDPRIVVVEPELIYTVLPGQLPGQDTGVQLPAQPGPAVPRPADPATPSAEYLRGYRDGVQDLARRLGQAGGSAMDLIAQVSYQDTDQAAWGLHATGVLTSPATGAGIRIAVLDTGFDLTHPDFSGRPITGRSFVPGEEVQDRHGHGTHCIGTAAGPAAPGQGPRYGVAPEAQIWAGKVLSDSGSGTDTNILAGLNWAVAGGCEVISMSLGADLDQVVQRYETVGRRALAAGSLLIAAAGNNAARRRGSVGFVGVPANSPSIMAVGAVDQTLAVADFSARSSALPGGQVDLAAPGVDVLSSWPMPGRTRSISGTSMATPHVAGLAALWAQTRGDRGQALWTTLVQSASRLDASSADVGTGLALAPQRTG